MIGPRRPIGRGDVRNEPAGDGLPDLPDGLPAEFSVYLTHFSQNDNANLPEIRKPGKSMPGKGLRPLKSGLTGAGNVVITLPEAAPEEDDAA